MMNSLIVVGMPRSGSTLLTRILNESPELFVVNDFYYLQYLESINAFDAKKSELNEHLSEEILERIKARIEKEDSPKLECGLFLSVDDEKRLESFVKNELQKDKYNWSELLEQIMSFAAGLLKKKIWGYNTPQDYLYLDILEQNFPNAKFIFMMRDPRSVLRSYKNVTSNGYHETNRYHPVVQTLAWRTSIRSFLKRKDKNNYLLIRYEDLIANPETEISRLKQFLKVDFSSIDINKLGSNSSFKEHKKTLDLTSTEIWLCEKLAHREMKEINYSLSASRPSLGDTKENLYLTYKVFNFYISRIVLSHNIRKRVWQLFKTNIKVN